MSSNPPLPRHIAPPLRLTELCSPPWMLLPRTPLAKPLSEGLCMPEPRRRNPPHLQEENGEHGGLVGRAII